MTDKRQEIFEGLVDGLISKSISDVTIQRRFSPNLLRDKIWQFTCKEKGKRFRSGHIIFSAGRKIATHPAKDIGAFFCSKAARYFLMYFGHANIVLTLIVSEGDDGIGHES